MAENGPINTNFNGSVAECRAGSKWLASVDGAVHNAGTQLHQCRSESEAAWRGQAGDAFRGNTDRLAQASDALDERANKVGKALAAFADDLDTIQRQVVHVRDHAREAGLVLAGKLIMPPGPTPGGAPTQPPAGSSPGATEQYEQQQAAFATAYGAHQRKVEAFDEASTTIAQLREREEEAHRALRDVLRQKGFAEKYTVTILSKGALAVSTHQSLVDSSISRLKNRVELYDEKIDSLKGLIGSPASTDPASEAAQRTTGTLKAERDAANHSLTKMQHLDNSFRYAGHSARANVGDLLKNSTKSWAPTAESAGRKVPWVGTAITAAGAAQGIHDGKPAAKEIEKAVGSTGASIAAGAAVGTMVGGPVGTVIGVGAGLVASYGVEKFVDWKNGPVEQANRALGIE